MNLISNAILQIKIREEWLQDSIKSMEAISKLPKELQEFDWNAELDETENGYSLTIHVPSNINESERIQWCTQIKMLLVKLLGIEWQKEISCSETFGILSWRGTSNLEGKILYAQIYNAPKPPLCRLEETTVTKQVKVYKAICPEEVSIQ